MYLIIMGVKIILIKLATTISAKKKNMIPVFGNVWFYFSVNVNNNIAVSVNHYNVTLDSAMKFVNNQKDCKLMKTSNL